MKAYDRKRKRAFFYDADKNLIASGLWKFPAEPIVYEAFDPDFYAASFRLSGQTEPVKIRTFLLLHSTSTIVVYQE